ncbi:snaclec 4-like [Nerophis lumbriciformis]|uniref:snaclec 4-like n=1 Tax=Nerophis lumbriciformis TaxID=546530 RepID=UPI002ADFDA18|nr:snaclec stejaggregin-A subunit beta-2-like [Nerophis lumbriciformis]
MALELCVLSLLCGISGLFTGAASQSTASSEDAGASMRNNQCPGGWTRLDNRCFILMRQQINFTAAEATCNLFGGNLASIHNQVEASVISGFFINLEILSPWIGLRNESGESDLFWTDQSEVDFILRSFSNREGCGTQIIDEYNRNPTGGLPVRSPPPTNLVTSVVSLSKTLHPCS